MAGSDDFLSAFFVDSHVLEASATQMTHVRVNMHDPLVFAVICIYIDSAVLLVLDRSVLYTFTNTSLSAHYGYCVAV